MIKCDGCGGEEIDDNDIKEYKAKRNAELKVAVETEFPKVSQFFADLDAFKK
jgi:hypothetical protein